MSAEGKYLIKQIMDSCDTTPELVAKSSYEEISFPVAVDAACYTMADTKCASSQTNKNFVAKNKTTSTKVLHVAPGVAKLNNDSTHICDIHAVISVNVVTSQHKDESINSFEKSRSMKNNVRSESGKRSKRISKCTCTKDECEKTGACVDTCSYSCHFGGVGPCSAFTLGTADFRNVVRESHNTMMIGGCRVPVYRNFKNRF